MTHDVAINTPNALDIEHPQIQTDRVNESSIALQHNQENRLVGDEPFDLVGRNDFIELAKKYGALQNPGEFWDGLFGHCYQDGKTFLNPQANYLTHESAEQILNYWPKFKHGIDFQHLPKGFHLVTNQASSRCEVIHYSAKLKEVQAPEPMPLSVTLSITSPPSTEKKPPLFTGKKQACYDALYAKIKNYCSEEELDAAFRHFSSIVEHDFGLNYDDLDLNASFFQADINPIVLLGRFETILTNPELKKQDQSKQWQVLPQLELYHAKDAIRALTDCFSDDNPCGFLIPEMNLSAKYLKQHGHYRSVHHFRALGGFILDFEDVGKLQKKVDDLKILRNKLFVYVKDQQLYIATKVGPAAYKEIPVPESLAHYKTIAHKVTKDLPRLRAGQSNTPLSANEEAALYDFAKQHAYAPINTDEADFWRYVAYQGKRNSIGFYTKAIECIRKVKFPKAFAHYKQNLFLLLAACTTQYAHSAKTESDEKVELQIWQKICSLVADFEKNMPPLMQIGGRRAGLILEGKVGPDYLHGCVSTKTFPNLACQLELFTADLDSIYSLSLADIANPDAKIKAIDEHKLRFATLLELYQTDIYQGARFYRQSGEWKPLSIKAYVKLQYSIHQQHQNIAKYIIPLLSTFNIVSESDLIYFNQIKSTETGLVHESSINCATAFMQDIQSNHKLSAKELAAMLTHLQTDKQFATEKGVELKVLLWLEKKYTKYFSKDYFKQKKQALAYQAFDLTEAEQKNLRQYQFKAQQIQWIQSIEVALKGKRTTNARDNDFNRLNQAFSKVRYVIPEADFNQLLCNLAALSNSFPTSSEPLITLLLQIQLKGGIAGFTQLFQYLTPLKVQYDSNLLNKIILFIQDVKPFVSHLKEQQELAFNNLEIEALLVKLLIALPDDTFSQEFFKESLTLFIISLNEIAKAHPLAKMYLLSTIEVFLKQGASWQKIVQLCNDIQDISLIFSHERSLATSLNSKSQHIPSSSPKNMLDFYSILAHYHDKPDSLMSLLKLIDVLDPYVRVKSSQILTKPLQQSKSLRDNALYLFRSSSTEIDYVVSDDDGVAHERGTLDKDNCPLFSELMTELSPESTLEENLSNKIASIINNQAAFGLWQTIKVFFKPGHLSSVVLVMADAIPTKKQPNTIYLWYNTKASHFAYLRTDQQGQDAQEGRLNRSTLGTDDYEVLFGLFYKNKPLAPNLNARLLSYRNKNTQKRIEPIQKRFILTFICQLLASKRSIQGIELLTQQLSQDSSLCPLLMKTLEKPPYPDVLSICQWIRSGEFSKRYKEFTQAPFGKRVLHYVFDKNYFRQQKYKYQGIAPQLFSNDLAQNLDILLAANRKKSLAQLCSDIKALSAHSLPTLTPLHTQALMCLCIEMLARTVGQKDPQDPSKMISQELNTTQVMTLYAMLATNNSKLISQIDTGEGKSRISMVLAAFQALRGKTVDVLTSDIDLSERDYLTYTPFFNALDIQTSLINFNTPAALYRKQGVNFSDDRQLFLLRNQCDILGKPFYYLDEEPAHRCLVLDEEDVFRREKCAEIYNYAQESLQLKHFIWVYPHLVKFMQEQISIALKNKTSTVYLTELAASFHKYLQKWESTEHYAKFKELCKSRPTQLTTWLESAYQAVHMKEKQHYAVTENRQDKMFTVVDAENKMRLTRKAVVLDQGRCVADSTFSEGLHQCLCALENQKAKDTFVIFPENATLRSSLTTNFIALYKDGQFYGISGSTGSEAAFYDTRINHEGYHFIVTPRQKPLKRQDKPIWFAKDEAQQIEFLKASIVQQLKKNNPILLICKDDNQSLKLYEALTEDKDIATLLQKSQYIHALSSPLEKKLAIDCAGKEGVLTISTVGNFGRGVDILTQEQNPLLVLAAYVPTKAQEIQISGRTGRVGKDGEYRSILNLQDYSFKNSQLSLMQQVKNLQGTMAIADMYQEEASKLYADFIEEVTQRFLKTYYEYQHQQKNEAILALLEEWSSYLALLQKDWQLCRKALVSALEEQNKPVFTQTFQAFVSQWTKSIPGVSNATGSSELVHHYKKKSDKIFAASQKHSHFFKNRKVSLGVQHAYDPSDDGQARIYDVPFAQLQATLRGERHLFADYYAWKEGRGDLFPDFSAIIRGERPIFASLMAIIARLIEVIHAWLATTVFTSLQADSEIAQSPLPHR